MSPNLTKWASKGKKKVEEIYNLTGPRPNSVAISAIVEIESSKYTTPDRKPKKRTPQQDQTGIDKSKDQEKSNVHTEKTLSEKSGSPPISLGQMSKALAERLQKKKIEKESIAINLLVDLEDSESEPESVHEEEHVEEVLEIAAQREEVPEIISSQSSLSEISSATSSRTSLVETKTSIRKVKAEKIPTEEKHKPKISSGKKQRLSRIEPIKKPIDLDAKIKEMNQSKIHEKQAGLEKIKKERVKTEAEANLSQLATTARTNKSSSEIKPVLPPIVKDTQPEAILKDAQLHKDFPTVDVSVTNKKILTKEKEKEIPSIPRTSIASTNESTKSVLESKIDNHHVVKFKEPIKKLSILKPVNKPPTAILRNSITEPSKPKTEHVTDVKPAPVFNPVKQKTKPAIAPKVEYKKTSVSKPASAHPLVDFMESDDDDLISDVKSRSAKSSRKSYSRGSSRLSESTLYDMHLKEIDQKPWFPGMNGREVTVPNIVLVVIEVLQNGEEEAKIEAISAIVYFYNTFKDEFADPLSSIIIPLLDMIHDENDSVREKITRAIGDIGVYSDETVTALIQMLNDSIENVRKAAILSLSELGISTKTQLEDAMKQLNMLPQDKAKKRVVNYLDILIARQNQKRKEHTIEKKKVCKVWTIQVKHAADAVHEPTGSQMPTIPPFDIYSDSVGSLFEILQ